MESRRVVPIRGDGNCMFRSISYCIYGSQENHREIRLRAVEGVVENWHRYKHFIVGNESYGRVRSRSSYKRLMSRDGEYAGHVELHCITELFTEYTFKVHIDGSRAIDFGRGSRQKHLLFSGNLDAGHYSVIEFK